MSNQGHPELFDIDDGLLNCDDDDHDHDHDDHDDDNDDDHNNDDDDDDNDDDHNNDDDDDDHSNDDDKDDLTTDNKYQSKHQFVFLLLLSNASFCIWNKFALNLFLKICCLN